MLFSSSRIARRRMRRLRRTRMHPRRSMPVHTRNGRRACRSRDRCILSSQYNAPTQSNTPNMRMCPCSAFYSEQSASSTHHPSRTFNMQASWVSPRRSHQLRRKRGPAGDVAPVDQKERYHRNASFTAVPTCIILDCCTLCVLMLYVCLIICSSCMYDMYSSITWGPWVM